MLGGRIHLIVVSGLDRGVRWLLTGSASEEDGATAAEYAVLIALIAAVIFAGAALLGTNVNTKLSTFGTDLGNM